MRVPACIAAMSVAGIMACGSTDSTDEGPPADTDVSIVANAARQGGLAFSPPELTVSISQGQSRIKWYNADSHSYSGAPHGTHRLVADDGVTFSSEDIPPGGTFATTIGGREATRIIAKSILE
jgi:hypothetical protein